MHNYIACSCDGWRGMNYNGIIVYASFRRLFVPLLVMSYVKVDTGYCWSILCFGNQASCVTTTGHTHFHSRPHSNATSFLQNNKGVGFPGSVGLTITG